LNRKEKVRHILSTLMWSDWSFPRWKEQILAQCTTCPTEQIDIIAAIAPEFAEARKREEIERRDEEAYVRRLAQASRLAREEEQRQEEEERERQREEAEAKVALRARQQARREAEASARRDEERLLAFLQAHGFADVRAKLRRGWGWRCCYPLHVAVEVNCAETVRLLLRSGADPRQQDSAGRTPEVLAQQQDVGGSHLLVLEALKL